MAKEKSSKQVQKKTNANKPNKKQIIIAGSVSGFLNGLFGSGGGVLAVMFLRKILGDEKKAHASATLMILIMSIVSFLLYMSGESVDFEKGLMFMPGGFAGAVVGSIFLAKIQSDTLKRIFGAVIAISGVVMLFR